MRSKLRHGSSRFCLISIYSIVMDYYYDLVSHGSKHCNSNRGRFPRADVNIMHYMECMGSIGIFGPLWGNNYATDHSNFPNTHWYYHVQQLSVESCPVQIVVSRIWPFIEDIIQISYIVYTYHIGSTMDWDRYEVKITPWIIPVLLNINIYYRVEYSCI